MQLLRDEISAVFRAFQVFLLVYFWEVKIKCKLTVVLLFEITVGTN